MSSSPFTPDDRALLLARGIPEEEALRHLDLLARPPAKRRLERPCTPGDGIERIPDDEIEALAALHDEAAGQGRVIKFVPASGAASRMFQDLVATDGPGSHLAAFADALPRFAFVADLERLLAASGRDLERLVAARALDQIREAFLGENGLGYADLPKGLVKFHAYVDESRTPFEEHLAEAAAYARNVRGEARVHLTVSVEHMDRFRRRVDEVRSRLETFLDTRFLLDFSLQHPSTDTLAADLEDRPLRDERGRLVLRPAGHGALLENLAALDGDLVFVKNIDNVVPDRMKPTLVRWKKAIGGLLVRLQREVFVHAARLRSPDADPRVVEEAASFAKARFGAAALPDAASTPPRSRRLAVLDALDRPLRVCGVVANVGEPGGGPFWVRDRDGRVTRQIVEAAEVDRDDPGQDAILRSATHFNPVDLACAVRDVEGRAFDLHRYVDPDAVIVTRKSSAGRVLKALERPGLWNGAMARWNTVFVEVPLETFAPVKTVFDLLRPEHQP